MRFEPLAHLAHRHAVAHRHGRRADEALLSGNQQRAFHWTASRIGAVEHPDRFARFRRFFHQVEQGRNEGIDAATEVLQVEQEHVRRRHHLSGRPADFAIEAEDRDVVAGIGLVRRLDHIVLLVALQPVLRSERRCDIDPAFDQRVERMVQLRGDRSRMRHQRYALALEWGSQFVFGQKAVNAEFHGAVGAASSPVKQAGSWKSGTSPA